MFKTQQKVGCDVVYQTSKARIDEGQFNRSVGEKDFKRISPAEDKENERQTYEFG